VDLLFCSGEKIALQQLNPTTRASHHPDASKQFGNRPSGEVVELV
jgi:hypothetical protein